MCFSRVFHFARTYFMAESGLRIVFRHVVLAFPGFTVTAAYCISDVKLIVFLPISCRIYVISACRVLMRVPSSLIWPESAR